MQSASDDRTDDPTATTFAGRFWRVSLVGCLGVVSLPFTLVPQLRLDRVPEELEGLPPELVIGLSMVNPLLLVLAGAALGAGLAPRLGLRSLIAAGTRSGSGSRRRLTEIAPRAAGIGALVGVGTVAADAAFQPLLPHEWVVAASAAAAAEGWEGAITGVLYGGLTEEIMLRWGAVSVFAWVGWRLFQRGRGTPAPVVMWVGVILAALVFGLGHLPAAAGVAPLDWTVALRTVLLNAMGGTVFGVLFWKRNLEAAMFAHATANLVVTSAAAISPLQP